MDKYELTMWYSELTNRIYAVIKNKRWQIVKKEDVTDWVLTIANKIFIESITDDIEEDVDVDEID